MFHGGLLVAVSLLYIAVLFGIAWFGDRRARTHGASRRRPIIYSLALAIYCTSWTFYGAVGQAATAGWSFASIFVGPILTFLLFWPVLAKMIRVAKHQKSPPLPTSSPPVTVKPNRWPPLLVWSPLSAPCPTSRYS
ncbi:hypothetical protein HAALTHF_20040n [Vreelandella aquamarina]|nr:hypothetical protein HAALTHF_20040n [Halomonas axialensis]